MRGVLEVFAFERDQTLITARVRALVDRHRQMTMPQELPWTILAGRHGGRHALLVEARTAAHASRRAEIDHQHPHRPVGLRLQDEAALELEHRAEHHGEHDGFPQEPRHRGGIGVAAQDGVDKRPKLHHAATHVEFLHRERQDGVVDGGRGRLANGNAGIGFRHWRYMDLRGTLSTLLRPFDTKRIVDVACRCLSRRGTRPGCPSGHAAGFPPHRIPPIAARRSHRP